MDWFLYDIILRHERVKGINSTSSEIIKENLRFSDDFMENRS